MKVLYKKHFERFNTQFNEDYNDINPKLYGNQPATAEDLKFYMADKRNVLFKYKNCSNTEEDFLINYGNKLATLELTRMTLVVEKTEDKISFKYYYFSKHRRVGEVFFRKASTIHFITYKFKTNDIFFGTINNVHSKKKRRAKLRRNYFGDRPFTNLMSIFVSNYNKLFSVLGPTDIHKVIMDCVRTFIDQIPNVKYDNTKKIDELMYKQYLDTRDIKAPNNYWLFMDKVPSPTKQILKKHGNKMIEAFMHVHNFKGDKIKKVLHNATHVNHYFFKDIEKIFGEEFIKHQHYDVLKSIIEYPRIINIDMDSFSQLSKAEKNNAFKVLMEFIYYDESINSYIDHLFFYNNIKKYEKIKWSSTDMATFRSEHILWTERWSYYTKGVYTRIYNEYFTNKIEEKINKNYYNYYPVILTTSKDYIDESALQNNCVKTYVDRPGSLIISLREDTPESTERATIEYSIRNTVNGIELVRVQSLGKYNARLPEKWTPVLEILDQRINNLVEEKQFELPKVKVFIGGNILESDTMFTEKINGVNGRLIWSNNLMYKLNNMFYYDIF